MKELQRQIKNLFWSIVWKLKKSPDLQSLVNSHFVRWSSSNHQNRAGLELALSILGERPAVIIETGTSNYGTDSSRLFDSYVRTFGGEFSSVDIDPYPANQLKWAKSKRTFFHIQDSLVFLKNLNADTKVDFIYLDSWDVDWANPLASAEHGYREILEVKKFIKKNLVLVIDDTPRELKWIPEENQINAKEFIATHGTLPGKGAFFAKALKGEDYDVLHHEYNLVIRFNSRIAGEKL